MYERRKTVLEDDEKAKWDEIDPTYMTSESDIELDQKKIKETHTPSWRSTGRIQNIHTTIYVYVLQMLYLKH